MFTSTAILLAFISGVFGACIGGTPAFIFCSFWSIICQLFQTAGVSTAVMDLYGSNIFFVPAVCFTGAAAASALAAVRKHDINGFDTWKSLAAFNDPILLLFAGVCGVIGYAIFRAAVVWGLPFDQGAFSVLTMGIIVRLCLSTGRKYDPAGLRILSKIPMNVWLTHIIMAAVLGVGAGWFAELTGFWSIGFGVSGVSLLFCICEPNLPATHHLTLVAGYAMQMTHNLVIACIFAIIAELICYIFCILFNNRCSTHIDGPALAIMLCSLVLFTMF